jgi:hypothetical protein
LIPEGREGRGWHCFAVEMRKVKDFFLNLCLILRREVALGVWFYLLVGEEGWVWAGFGTIEDWGEGIFREM